MPGHIDTSMPSVQDWADHLLDQQLNCHGLVTAIGVTYCRRHAGLANAVKKTIQQRLESGTLQAIELPDQQTYYARSNLFDQPLPRVSQRLQILSPFDNFIIQRARLQSLFNFDYQIECYVPAPKRRYGYFALPLLYKDQFVGRMDCKAFRNQRRTGAAKRHFKNRCLVYSIKNAKPPKAEINTVCTALAAALPDFATFQACDQVSVHDVWPRPGTQILQNRRSKTLLTFAIS